MGSPHRRLVMSGSKCSYVEKWNAGTKVGPIIRTYGASGLYYNTLRAPADVRMSEARKEPDNGQQCPTRWA